MRLINKKEIRKIRFYFILFLIVLLSSNLVYALGTKLYCLEKGQVIKFSECNPNIKDFSCDSTKCQICVREISNDVFCPENINTCNKACVPLEDTVTPEAVVITLLQPSELYFSSEEKIIDFTFQVNQPNKIRNCSLLMDDINVITTNGLIRSGTNKISYFVSIGSHFWGIQCVLRDSPQLIVSERRALKISDQNSSSNNSTDNSPSNSPAPPVQEDTNSGGSSGGGGGSGGSSSNSKKSNITKNITSEIAKNESIQLEEETPNSENESLEEINPETTFSITGGVIGVNSKRNIRIAFVVLLSILAIYAFIYYVHKLKTTFFRMG